MHSSRAAISAAEENAEAVSWNFQNSANIEISTHPNATKTNLCSWIAYALSRAVVSKTEMPNQHSQDPAPSNRDEGLCHRTSRAAANPSPSDARPSTRIPASFRRPTAVMGGRWLLSAKELLRSSPADFRHRISALKAKKTMHRELRTNA